MLPAHGTISPQRAWYESPYEPRNRSCPELPRMRFSSCIGRIQDRETTNQPERALLLPIAGLIRALGPWGGARAHGGATRTPRGLTHPAGSHHTPICTCICRLCLPDRETTNQQKRALLPPSAGLTRPLGPWGGTRAHGGAARPRKGPTPPGGSHYTTICIKCLKAPKR